MTDWRPLATALAEQLTAQGVLTDPRWRQALLDTPRHHFVPEHPIADAYSRMALVTQSRVAPGRSSADGSRPTSSASAPDVVAVMLDRLDVKDGHRVLEIGTGTGYNAALLCHRLGEANVSSIDIDPTLVDDARGVLAALGYHPTLSSGDGYDGLACGAPHDRILATCAVTHVPPAWIRQLAEGGRIVAPLAANSPVPLLILDKVAPDEVVGHFDPHQAGFMPLRPHLDNPLGAAESTGLDDLGMAYYGTTSVDPRRLHHAETELALFCRFHLPGLRTAFPPDASRPDRVARLIIHTDTAMADVCLTPNADQRWTVVQRGPRRIWDTVEAAINTWDHLDRPQLCRFGVSALDDVHRQYVWLDDPAGPYSWPLPL